MDKVKFYKYCKLNNFLTPPTFFPNDKTELNDIAEQIKFPCIIKPPRADNVWWKFFSEKVLRIQNAMQLHEVYDRSLQATDSPIVQEWILGKDSNLNSCTFYYDRSHKPVITFTSRKLRQWPIEAGEICLGEEIRNEYLVEQTLDLFKGVQFAGVGSLEMKLNDRDGKYYIMEANVCRLPLRFKIVEAGGVELLYTMYSEALGLNNSTSTTQRFRGAKWISLHRDFLAARAYHARGELTFKDWLKSIRGVNTFAVLSVLDPLPFVFEIHTSLMSWFRDKIFRIGKFLKSINLRINKNPDKI
jgi:predicted ATP-grasp superfamily ATP-dependent carboligase